MREIGNSVRHRKNRPIPQRVTSRRAMPAEIEKLWSEGSAAAWLKASLRPRWSLISCVPHTQIKRCRVVLFVAPCGSPRRTWPATGRRRCVTACGWPCRFEKIGELYEKQTNTNTRVPGLWATKSAAASSGSAPMGCLVLFHTTPLSAHAKEVFRPDQSGTYVEMLCQGRGHAHLTTCDEPNT